ADLSVEVDNERAAAAVVAHLAGLGHRRIAHVSGPLSTTTGAERAAGYREALRAHGITPDASLVAEAAAYSDDAGYEATLRVLAGRPSATLAANALLMLGPLAAGRERETLCILGPSGCGKTTLLRAMHGLVELDGGAVRIDGSAVDRPRRNVAMVFQHFGLFPWKRVDENVAFGLEAAGLERQTIG